MRKKYSSIIAAVMVCCTILAVALFGGVTESENVSPTAASALSNDAPAQVETSFLQFSSSPRIVLTRLSGTLGGGVILGTTTREPSAADQSRWSYKGKLTRSGNRMVVARVQLNIDPTDLRTGTNAVPQTHCVVIEYLEGATWTGMGTSCNDPASWSWATRADVPTDLSNSQTPGFLLSGTFRTEIPAGTGDIPVRIRVGRISDSAQSLVNVTISGTAHFQSQPI